MLDSIPNIRFPRSLIRAQLLWGGKLIPQRDDGTADGGILYLWSLGDANAGED